MTIVCHGVAFRRQGLMASDVDFSTTEVYYISVMDGATP